MTWSHPMSALISNQESKSEIRKLDNFWSAMKKIFHEQVVCLLCV